jgi:hypothetical protein
VRDASLVVIACEGAVTEPDYFNGLKGQLHNPRLHVEVLLREDPSHSSPVHVQRMLEGFTLQYRLREGDALWLVADRDPQSWSDAMLSEVAAACRQRDYRLALSNPRFELWLWLHFEDVPNCSPERREELQQNRDDLLKRLVAARRPAKASHFEMCAPTMHEAIARARALDTKPEHRWPQTLGTHVYRLVEDLLRRGAGTAP